MAYLISEEAQDLLQDVKNFCDKEVQSSARNTMFPANGRRQFMIKRSSRAIRLSRFRKSSAARAFPCGCSCPYRADGDRGRRLCHNDLRQWARHEAGPHRGQRRAEAACLRSDPRRRLRCVLSVQSRVQAPMPAQARPQR